MVTCKDCFHCEACKPLVEQCNKLVGEDGYKIQFPLTAETGKGICKNFIDKSLIEILPVMPGDKLFRVVNLLNGENIIVEGIALEYAETFENGKINKRIYFWANGEKFTVRNYSLWLKISEIGETVFSTREEAERVLKERADNDT